MPAWPPPGSGFHSILSYPGDAFASVWKTGGAEGKNGTFTTDGTLSSVVDGLVANHTYHLAVAAKPFAKLQRGLKPNCFSLLKLTA